MVGKKFSTLNVASLRSPPTFSGAAGRVCVKLIVPVGSPTTWDCGRIRHALKPKVKMTGLGNVIAEPTRTLWSTVNHGNGLSLFWVVEYVHVEASSRMIRCASL